MHTVSVENEIEILKEELAIEKRKLERIKRRSGPKGVGGNTSYLDADAIHADHHHEAMTDLQQVLACKAEIDEIEAEIAKLERSVGRIRNCVASLDETTKKVIYLRDVCGLSLVDIAAELDLSYGYVKNISAQNHKT